MQEEPGYGADALRLWVSSVDYAGDVLIGPQILRQMSDMYRKLRGTMRFLLANLHDWKVCSGGQTYVIISYSEKDMLRGVKEIKI
jgi:isoleucyl-tRNA synthetase